MPVYKSKEFIEDESRSFAQIFMQIVWIAMMAFWTIASIWFFVYLGANHGGKAYDRVNRLVPHYISFERENGVRRFALNADENYVVGTTTMYNWLLVDLTPMDPFDFNSPMSSYSYEHSSSSPSSSSDSSSSSPSSDDIFSKRRSVKPTPDDPLSHLAGGVSISEMIRAKRSARSVEAAEAILQAPPVAIEARGGVIRGQIENTELISTSHIAGSIEVGNVVSQAPDGTVRQGLAQRLISFLANLVGVQDMELVWFGTSNHYAVIYVNGSNAFVTRRCTLNSLTGATTCGHELVIASGTASSSMTFQACSMQVTDPADSTAALPAGNNTFFVVYTNFSSSGLIGNLCEFTTDATLTCLATPYSIVAPPVSTSWVQDVLCWPIPDTTPGHYKVQSTVVIAYTNNSLLHIQGGAIDRRVRPTQTQQQFIGVSSSVQTPHTYGLNCSTTQIGAFTIGTSPAAGGPRIARLLRSSMASIAE